jgi:tRNA threonylcarbamoyladenosine modification (KEOPS) complex Cgi121 subunit
LLLDIPELSRHVWISGFNRKPAKVEEVLRSTQEKLPEVHVQLVDLGKVAGSRYLFLATYNALKSFYSKQHISRTLSMEILLYVSAKRQINEALKSVGIAVNTQEIAAIAVGPSRMAAIAARDLLEQLLGVRCVDELLDSWSADRIDAVQKNFGIASEELSATMREGEDACKAIERLAIERAALLTVRK